MTHDPFGGMIVLEPGCSNSLKLKKKREDGGKPNQKKMLRRVRETEKLWRVITLRV
jgi:hypothetical protein